MNIKKIILEEINNFDWVKPLLDVVPFEEAKNYKTYRVHPTKVLQEAIINCKEIGRDWIYNSRVATVESKSNFTHSTINCGNPKNDVGRVLCLFLKFYHPNTKEYVYFWVTDDMVHLYEDHTLNNDVKYSSDQRVYY